MNDLVSKKVLFIIAHKDFRDEEYREPREILESMGCEITVASSSKDTAVGKLGLKVQPDILLSEADVNGFDAVIFVGGGGSMEYFNNSTAHKIAIDTYDSGKVLAAICIAPSILANAGVLKGKKATVFSSEEPNIKAKGSIYTGSDVEIDGNIVTADGPKSATKFGLAIAEKLI